MEKKTYKVTFNVLVRGFFSDTVTLGSELIEDENLKSAWEQAKERADHFSIRGRAIISIVDVKELN